jgi:hypothetical protein
MAERLVPAISLEGKTFPLVKSSTVLIKLSQDYENRKYEIREQLVSAAEGAGFLTLVDHGISIEEIEANLLRLGISLTSCLKSGSRILITWKLIMAMSIKLKSDLARERRIRRNLSGSKGPLNGQAMRTSLAFAARQRIS